ncbi:MAG: histidine phosphatase family protein [Chloroflexota bacterium]|nr:histidine phosphatase family protein [Chloroflexota bacterium]
MQKTTIILVRHGETQWNRERRFQGHSDSPLTGLGRAQAKQVAERLAMEGVEAIYSSDSGRAFSTASFIGNRLGLPVIPKVQLREILVGKWEGLYIQEIKERYAEEYAAWAKDQTLARGGGETRLQLRERAWGAITDIIAENPNRTVVVVSHGGTLQAIISSVLSIPLEKWHGLRGMENCAMTWLELEEGDWIRLKRYNVLAFGVAPIGDVEDELGEAQ